MLTIGNIKAIIEEAETWRGVTDDTPVRVAMQPSWPFEYELDEDRWGMTVIGSSEERPQREQFGEDHIAYHAALIRWSSEADGLRVLYLAEARQVGYLPEEARAVVGWS